MNFRCFDFDQFVGKNILDPSNLDAGCMRSQCVAAAKKKGKIPQHEFRREIVLSYFMGSRKEGTLAP